MSEELITFEARIFNEKDYYIDDIKVTKELFYKIKNKCIEENKIIEENQQLKEEIKQGDELIKHWIKEAEELNDKNFRLEQCLNVSNNELNKLISVLDEIREYIKECTLINEISTAIRLKDTLAGKDLLQILDKVKE